MKIKRMSRVVILPLCAMFTACSEYNPTDLTVQQAATINEYTRNFVTRYGDIDPNHTWGFGNVTSELPSMSTRIEYDRGDNEDNYNYSEPPAFNKYDENGDETAAYKKILERFRTETESDDVFFIWGTFYVQHIHSTSNKQKDPETGEETEVDDVYFAARDFKNPNRNVDYTTTNPNPKTGEKISGLNNKNTVDEEKYRGEDGNSFTMFAGLGYDSEDDKPQFKCVKEDGSDIENCKYIILLIDGNFYLGFDLGYGGGYTDWIIRIIPSGGKKNEDTTKYRIMCEDLGSTSDFDFNDIVFDYDPLAVTENNVQGNITYDITIMVQAAGGTLPVYISSNNVPTISDEVHYILTKNTNFEQDNTSDTKIPVNVGFAGFNNGKSIPAKPKTIKGLQSKDPASIKLYRKSPFTDSKWQGAITELIPHGIEQIPQNHNGAAPFKICVPVTTKWTIENGDIGEAYNGFDKWVENEAENTTNAGFDKVPSWTEDIKNGQLLMEPNPTGMDEGNP